MLNHAYMVQSQAAHAWVLVPKPMNLFVLLVPTRSLVCMGCSGPCFIQAAPAFVSSKSASLAAHKALQSSLSAFVVVVFWRVAFLAGYYKRKQKGESPLDHVGALF